MTIFVSSKSTKKLPSAKHLTCEDYGPYCEIATKEPPTGYQQKLIDAGTFPASLMVVNQKRFCEMTNAVAENGVAGAVDDEALDLLNGLDADESAFVGGVADEPTDEHEMEQAADAAAVAAESVGGEPANTSPDVSPADSVDHVDPVDPEIVSLRKQLDKLRSQLCQQQYSDREISEQSAKVRQLSDEVRDLESQVKETKGELTAAKERHDSAVRELQGMIEDRGRGQRRLALGLPAAAVDVVTSENLATTAEKPISSEKIVDDCPLADPHPSPQTDEHAASPISVLAQKQMIAQFGKDEHKAAKDREEPWGMSATELGILEAAEIATVGDLEKMMREDAWWHQKLPKMGEKKIAKLVETLRVWRTKFPMPAL